VGRPAARHAVQSPPQNEGASRPPDVEPSFYDDFAALFDGQFGRLFRYLHRLSGDPDLAGDLAQDAFVRLYRRGSMPYAPGAWLVTTATNLFRNARSTRSRRERLLTVARGEEAHSDPPPSAEEAVNAEATRLRVRKAIDEMPERERQLLLLRAEGFSYREIAAALELNEASVGTLLARARDAFRKGYGSSGDAP
jgi:RNA polymerase sigma factor (sigma-70 family)